MKNLKLYENFLTEETNTCEHCGVTVSSNENLCKKCDDEGWWIDPSGGLHSPDDDDPAAMYEEEQLFTLGEFKNAFRKEYSYISHSLKDSEIQEFLNQKHVKGLTIEKATDLFSDHLLSQGLADEVQESKVTKFKDFFELNEVNSRGLSKEEFDKMYTKLRQVCSGGNCQLQSKESEGKHYITVWSIAREKKEEVNQVLRS